MSQPRIHGLISVAAIVAIAVMEVATARDHPELHLILNRLIAVPIAWAAITAGRRGGVLAAGTATLALAVQYRWLSTVMPLSIAAEITDALSFWFVGVIAGILSDRERSCATRYRKIEAELSGVSARLHHDTEAMKRAERLSAIGQLSAGLAHEIRNPLASIAGAAAILERSPATDDKHRRCVEIIAKESRRLNGLLSTFLNFARPRPPHLKQVDLPRVLEGVVDLAAHGSVQQAITIRTEIDSALPLVECDPEQLEQVLLNLLMNAMEASPNGAEVVMSARTAGANVEIQVVDEGSGVAPEDIDKLFDPFFTTKEHGTGLGLPVAHQIMQQMGGALLAAPNATRGMTFRVLVPLPGASS